MTSQTIFALSSGHGRAGIAVIRISGSKAGLAAETLSCRDLPLPRSATLRTFKNPQSGDVIDEGLLIWFPMPQSFTGENVIELHLHGGSAVISSILQALSVIDGLRMAEPGEFSRQAFENNKLDLTEIEGIADLINAETENQRRQAILQMQGLLGDLYESWRKTLLNISVQIEAVIDFSDEEIPEDLENNAKHFVVKINNEISQHLKDKNRGEILRKGLYITIIGAPNVGKSSFINLLTQRNVSIVSDIAGTTRDLIETRLDVGGNPVIISDTAGLCHGRDLIEKEGIKRAIDQTLIADFKIAIYDITKKPDLMTNKFVDSNTLVLANKIDAGSHFFPDDINGQQVSRLSILTGDGIEEALSVLTSEIEKRCHLTSSPMITQERHRKALEECCESLNGFLQIKSIELRAEEIRLAVRALGRITGLVDVEHILDGIFNNFCIGK